MKHRQLKRERADGCVSVQDRGARRLYAAAWVCEVLVRRFVFKNRQFDMCDL